MTMLSIFTIKRISLAIILIGLIAVPFLASDFYTEQVAKALIFGIFALSLNLLVGATGLVSFGHAAYFGIAAYAVVLLSPEFAAVNFWWSLPLSLFASALAAFLVGLLVIRTKGVYFIMVTLAFAQMFYFLFHDTDLGGGSDGIYLNFKPSAEIMGFVPLDFSEKWQLYALILFALIVSMVFLHRLSLSPFGRVLAGIKSNEHRMLSLGYNTYFYKLAAFTIAGGLAGLAGYLYAVLFGFVTPELLSWHHSGNVLLMVILGGIGSIYGSVLGAFSLLAIQEVFSDLTKHWQLLMGLLIVFAVMFLPGGIAAIPSRWRAWRMRKQGDLNG